MCVVFIRLPGHQCDPIHGWNYWRSVQTFACVAYSKAFLSMCANWMYTSIALLEAVRLYFIQPGGRDEQPLEVDKMDIHAVFNILKYKFNLNKGQ